MQKPLNFILIDDSTFDLFVYERLLVKSGITGSINKYHSARAALSWLSVEGQQLPETVILLDLQMPDMNGFEFIEAYHSLDDSVKEKIKIYMLSSTIDSSDIERVRKSPYIIELLSKPLEVDLLIEKIS